MTIMQSDGIAIFLVCFFIFIWIIIGVFIFINHSGKSNASANDGTKQKTLFDLLFDFSPQTAESKAEAIGAAGEMRMRTELAVTHNLPEKYILRNVLIPTADGGTTEIDIIAITSRGVVIFECKNMSGNIYGDGDKKQWLQYVGKEKQEFYNPLRQNYKHQKCLETILRPYGKIPIFAFLAPMGSRGKWHFKNLRKTDWILGYNASLPDFLAKTPVSDLTNSLADELVEVLGKYQAKTDEDMQKHKEYLAKRHGNN